MRSRIVRLVVSAPGTRLILVAGILLAPSCGGTSTTPSQQSPSAPAPSPAAAPTPGPTINGSLSATNGGQPVAGAQVSVGTIASTTDASGRFSLTLPAGTGSQRFTIAGSTLLTRTGFLGPGGSRAIDLDAFALTNFDQAYFRAIARNGYEQPNDLQPLRRWTRAPMLYIRTVDDTGQAILAEVLQQVVSLASAVIPQYSHGRFGLAGIEQGTDTRAGMAGWITVTWTRDASQFCGTSNVGAEGGTVKFTYDQPGCACGSQKIRPRTVKHEFGHAMGLWHTGQSADLMSGLAVSGCDMNISARELEYLEYLYRRPVGNTDPDNDPSTAPLLAPARTVN
jgi:hypothetical protein